MLKFAANLTMLFNELPFLDRFAAAAAAGFEAVEFLFPYDFEADEIARRLHESGLQLVLHNLPAGHWAAGERGIACDPARVDEFRSGVARALTYAKTLGVPQLNCLAGILPVGVEPSLAHRTLVNNLRFAATQLDAAGLRLLIEPINTFDIPGFYLSGTRQAAALIAEIDAPNLFIQYDIYHMQRMEGELAATLQKHLGLIRHIQLADNPGRGEPGSGEINYAFLFQWLTRIGYAGWIGCEYKPQGETLAGLGWRSALAPR